MIRRHTLSAITMHWFNALCWLLLLGSGFALLSNASMQPAGSWWSSFWANVVGEQRLLSLHIYLGFIWSAVYIIYCLFFLRREALPFLKEVFRLSPASDLTWCIRKVSWLVLGESGMRRHGLNPELPPQGFYNAGQKLVAIAAVLCSILLVLTGFLLSISVQTRGLEVLVQWALFIHLACAGIMAVLLPVHIYMAAFAPGERPSLLSMLTGFVPREFARHHNPLWYEASVENSRDMKNITSENKQ